MRNAVLPEITRQLRRCLPVVELGLPELTGTSSISRFLQNDKFSRASESCWKSKKNPAYTATAADTEEPTHDAWTDVQAPKADSEAVTDGVKEDSGWGSSATADAWNNLATDDVWGKSDSAESPWGVVSVEPDEVDKSDFSAWQDTPELFFQFLGPTALPVTHTTGIVMQAMRKVKAVVPPNNNTPKSAVQADDAYEPSADAVEADMDRVFTKIVLSPMIDWDAGMFDEYTKPKILEASQGPVVGGAADASALGEEKPSVKPFDPLGDDITLLVESTDAVKAIKEGMGIGGVWVQLVREGPIAPKKKKSKSKKMFNGYWYLEQIAIVTPTFWLALKED